MQTHTGTRLQNGWVLMQHGMGWRREIIMCVSESDRNGSKLKKGYTNLNGVW